MKHIYLFLLLFFSLNVHSQNELKNWYFGTGTDGLTFVNNIPQKTKVKLSGVGYEGMVVVNDPLTGDLLFYSDGIRVVDKNHTVMANGSGLTGHVSGAQCVQSCPIPGTCAKQFYLFTNSAYDNTGGKISYSIVDFSTNPLGVVTTKNTLFWNGPSDQGMCLVNKPNTNDYWLIANIFNTATYYVWPITSTGIGTPLTFTFSNTGSCYQMNYDKVSKKISLSGGGLKKVTLLDFDVNAGVLSNEVQLAANFVGVGSTRFSPDGTKLYAGLSPSAAVTISLYQYDFNTGVWTDMKSCCYSHDFKVGPDGKMYYMHTYYGQQPLGVIEKPNFSAVGNACNYHTLNFTPEFFDGEVRRFPETVILPTSVTANTDFITLTGTSVNIAVLANDVKGANDFFILDTILIKPKYGTATITGSTINYVANQNVCATDTFVYRLKNQDCSLDTATVLIKENNCLPHGLCSGATHVIWKDDFGSGATPFVGKYPNIDNTHYTNQKNGIGGGNYAITNKFTNFSSWHTVNEDHTPNDNNGYFLIIDGGSPTFYSTRVDNLCPNTNYTFSSWAMNMDKPSYPSLPTFIFKVADIQGNAVGQFTTAAMPVQATPTWVHHGFTFNSGNNTSLNLSIAFTSSGFNDFAFDDLEFTVCGPTVSLTSVASSCSNNINVNATVGTGYANPVYKWYKKDINGSWQVEANQTNATYTDNTPTTQNWYKVVIQDGAGACSYVEDSIMVNFTPASLTKTNIDTTICSGQIYFGHNTSGTYNDTLKNVAGCDSIIRAIKLTVLPQNIAFIAPDSVCVNSAVNIINTSTCTTTSYWSFCSADINSVPDAVNIGNPGNILNGPVFSDYVKDNNGNYYLFVTNFTNGNLVRLDFGNNMLNTPTAVNLGNFGGRLIPGGTEGVQVVYNENKWYAIVAVGKSNSVATAALVKIEFGNDITNPAPVATNWGNIGNLNYPHDITLFKENGNWYGMLVNKSSNTVSLINFTNSFSNIPTGRNIGNIGALDNPTGIYAVYSSSKWYAFVVNSYQDNPARPNYGTITRLDFGNSLLNTPTGINLGDFGGLLHNSRDIYILKTCGNDIGFVVNQNSNDMIRLDFNNDISSTPSANSLGITGTMNSPHSISKFFRVGSDLYSFATNLQGSITRFRFKGCSDISMPGADTYTPAAVTYSAPGTYRISLVVDDGLPTQASFCKDIVVVNSAVKANNGNDTTICTGNAIQMNATGVLSYSWSPATYLSNSSIGNPVSKPLNDIRYIVTGTSAFGCISKDTINISLYPLPTVRTNNDTTICGNVSSTVQLNTTGANTYSWSPATGLSAITIANPVATPVIPTKYFVTGTDANGCKAIDSVIITIFPKTIISKSRDTSICKNATVQLFAGGGAHYQWSSLTGIINNTASSTPSISLPATVNSATYYVVVTDVNSCTGNDSIKVTNKPAPVFTVSPDQDVCTLAPVQLSASGGNSYLWSPAIKVNNASLPNPLTNTDRTTTYTVLIKESTCNNSITLSTTVKLLPPLDITTTKSNDLDCSNGSAKLTASGADTYTWSPATGLNNATIFNPVASPFATQKYIVKGSRADGCVGYDTIIVYANYSNNASGYYMPNAFSPNGDGVNDCYGIKYWGAIKELEFVIYDRWGNKVFYTTNPGNCWDGIYNGQQANIGAYVYSIKAVTACGAVKKSGQVVLVR